MKVFVLLHHQEFSHTTQHMQQHQAPGKYPWALCLDSSPLTPHQRLLWTKYYQSSSGRPGHVAQPRVRALCWVLSYTGSMWKGNCNTCGDKRPSDFFWFKSTWLAVWTHSSRRLYQRLQHDSRQRKRAISEYNRCHQLQHKQFVKLFHVDAMLWGEMLYFCLCRNSMRIRILLKT